MNRAVFIAAILLAVLATTPGASAACSGNPIQYGTCYAGETAELAQDAAENAGQFAIDLVWNCFINRPPSEWGDLPCEP